MNDKQNKFYARQSSAVKVRTTKCVTGIRNEHCYIIPRTTKHYQFDYRNVIELVSKLLKVLDPTSPNRPTAIRPTTRAKWTVKNVKILQASNNDSVHEFADFA